MAKQITYRFEVRAMVALADDPHDVNFYTEEVATSVAHRRALEKTLHHHLKKFDCGDCDVELMDFTVEDDGTEPEPERDEAYERAAARDRLDGFSRTKGRDWT